MAQKDIDLYRAVHFLEGIDGGDVARTVHQVVRHFMVEKYKQNNPWQDVLEAREKQYGDAEKYNAAMQRFIQLAIKVLLERKAAGGQNNAWTHPLLLTMFDLESDPTLYNDKWENPQGKHRPAIQKGCPQMFFVTRDTFIDLRGSAIIAQSIQKNIQQMGMMDSSLKQKQEAAKAADATPEIRGQATKQADLIKKLRKANIESIMRDVKLLIDSNKRIRFSLTPPLPAAAPNAAAAADSDSDDGDPSAPAEAVAPPAAVTVPGEEILPKVAAMIGEYIKRDAPRLLNDLDAVMKLLYKMYSGLQGVRKKQNALFLRAPLLCSKNDQFAKTGSGQTYQDTNAEQKDWRFLLSAGQGSDDWGVEGALTRSAQGRCAGGAHRCAGQTLRS
eukprot:COSAG06_NODE_84_length_25090_cov_20.561042_15_plen_387_part_00